MTVIEEIEAERKRQIEEEGWTAEHDDRHQFAEMALAAACYALSSTWVDHDHYVLGQRGRTGTVPGWRDIRGLFWPPTWSKAWWKPTTRRRDLVKAAALIVAEIERLDRLDGKN